MNSGVPKKMMLAFHENSINFFCQHFWVKKPNFLVLFVPSNEYSQEMFGSKKTADPSFLPFLQPLFIWDLITHKVENIMTDVVQLKQIQTFCCCKIIPRPTKSRHPTSIHPITFIITKLLRLSVLHSIAHQQHP